MKKLITAILIMLMPVMCASCDKSGVNSGSSDKMTVAYIDTDSLLKKWERYRDMGDEYIKERDALAKKVKAKASEISGKSSLSDKDRSEMLELQQKDRELKSRWSEKKQIIVNEIRAVAAEVASEQNINIVIDNSESSPVIEYGGVDITTDILTKLKEKNNKKNEKSGN